MKKLIQKELALAASPLSYFFLIAAFLTLVPSYPILLSAFFTSLGIFYSFQTMRETAICDILFCFRFPKRRLSRQNMYSVSFWNFVPLS